MKKRAQVDSSSLGSTGKYLLVRSMPFSGRFTGAFLVLFAILAPALLAGGLALAGDDAPRPPAVILVKKLAPAAAQGTTSEVPPAALGYDDGKADPSADDEPGLKIPNAIQFGDNTLQFDADRKRDLPPGIDANEQAVINKAAPSDSPLPSYFGLRFTTPMH